MKARVSFNQLWAGVLGATLLLSWGAWAQSGRASLAVAPVKATPSVSTAMDEANKETSLARVVATLDEQLLDRLNASRKFQVVARGDLNAIIREQELAESGNVSADDPRAARSGELAGAKYVLVTTLDDFDDQTEALVLSNLGQTAKKRKVRIGLVAKIYDSTTGNLMESASVQITSREDQMNSVNLKTDSDRTDVALVNAARQAASEIVLKIADAVFPVRVLARRDQQVTLNRGAGGGVETGQVWNVFALGDELVDPDTNEMLGREEVLIGKVRVISVRDRLSTAEVIEDFGIDKGAVLRPAPGQ